MNDQVIEWAPYRLGAGRTEADLLAASDVFQEAFLKDQPGFIRRETVRLGRGEYADLVYWRSRANADAVMKKVEESPACHAFFSVMALDSQDPGAGVAHYDLIRSYG